MRTRYAQRLAKYPPCLIRLLARSATGIALTDQALVDRGCPLPVVKALSYQTEWGSASLWDVDRFLSACGADPLNTKWVRNTNRLIKPSTPTQWSWVRRAPHWPAMREVLVIYARTLKT